MRSSDFNLVESHDHEVEHQVRESKDTDQGVNIKSIEFDSDQQIKKYTPSHFKDSRGIVYSQAIPKGITLEKQESSQFKLSDLLRGPLSVEAEEEIRIQKEVQKRVDEKLVEQVELAEKKGYEKGLAEGQSAGQQMVLEQAKPSLEHFDRLISDIENVRSNIFKTNEEFLIHMVCQLSKSVILRELKEDSDYIKRLILGLMDRLETKENIKIFLGESEYSSLDKIRQGLAQSLGQLKNISIEMDPSIKLGGCRLETDFSEVDASIETQLHNLDKGMTSG